MLLFGVVGIDPEHRRHNEDFGGQSLADKSQRSTVIDGELFFYDREDDVIRETCEVKFLSSTLSWQGSDYLRCRDVCQNLFNKFRVVNFFASWSRLPEKSVYDETYLTGCGKRRN